MGGTSLSLKISLTCSIRWQPDDSGTGQVDHRGFDEAASRPKADRELASSPRDGTVVVVSDNSASRIPLGTPPGSRTSVSVRAAARPALRNQYARGTNAHAERDRSLCLADGCRQAIHPGLSGTLGASSARCRRIS